MTRETLSIAGIAAHTAPKGLSGFLRWLAHRRKNRKQGLPRKELTYAEGVDIVKAFLEYAATHGVGELQRFTASKVPRCVPSSNSFLHSDSMNPFIRGGRDAHCTPEAEPQPCCAVPLGSSKRQCQFRKCQSTKPRTSCGKRSLPTQKRSTLSVGTGGGRSAEGSSPESGSK